MERGAHYGEDFNKEYQKALKVHGHYTEGFYENELQRLKQKLGNPNG